MSTPTASRLAKLAEGARKDGMRMYQLPQRSRDVREVWDILLRVAGWVIVIVVIFHLMPA